MSSRLSCSDLLALWHRRVDDGPDAVREVLVAARSVPSRRSRGDLDRLLAILDGSTAEAAAWWELLCGWPAGFPPAAALTPVDRYPLP